MTLSPRREPLRPDADPSLPTDADLPPVVSRTDSPRTTWRTPAAPGAPQA